MGPRARPPVHKRMLRRARVPHVTGRSWVRDILNSDVLHFPEYRAQLGQCPRLSYPIFSDCSTNYCGAVKKSPLQPAIPSGVSFAFDMIKRYDIISDYNCCLGQFIF
ncbi:hypothetical protein Y032_0086g1949 [Ancylostoma ceylanicum]|uniref:Uncharacterized protein n=1 Tax=Ancylostoma ceylanicum TaxID=53326 RepID=A0A016TPZ6_9BILA|nr:hypothetical protein Y032_0086g1949 [Ancylostoma ceylanicum]